MLKVFVYWRTGLFIIAFLSSLAITKIANGGPGAIGPNAEFNYWLSWAQWDGGHFLDIVQKGYQLPSDSAFFPLYPVTVRLLSTLTLGNFLISGLVISGVSFCLFLFILKELLHAQYPKISIQNTLFAYIFYPASFYAVSFYSEGLYLLLSTTAFLFFYQKKYSRAFLFSSLSSLTRPFGILLTIALLVALIMTSIRMKKHVLTKNNLKYFALSVFPPAIYILYLLYKFQNPFAFLSTQSLWGREAMDPISTAASYIFPILSLQIRPVVDYIDLAVFALFFTALIIGVKKLNTAYWIYSMLVVLIPSSTGTLSSIPRYTLASIGVFILIGDYLSSHPKLRPFIFTVFLALQIFLLVRFINGYWAG